ncbi:MAG: UvrD-helicase domain-containing protein, partial [bacterium]
MEQENHSAVEQILDPLNPHQREAVTHTQGPLLVLAGAGSGKTRVIIYRIAYLIAACGVAPWNILAVTFTNKAAAEMRERAFQLVPERAEGIWIATFHSFCARLIRQHAEHLGFERGFSIYDRSDQTTVVRQAMKKSSIYNKNLKPSAAINMISRAKSKMLSPEEYRATIRGPLEEQVADIYDEYEAILKQNQALDFDDLLLYGVRLLSECDEVREHYQHRFQHVLVDEYQDTNHPQYLIARTLSRKYRNLCVVGDDDQSIYRWRGAQLSNILEFERDHDHVKVIRLEQNYRSTKTILDAANAVVAYNLGRREKKLWTSAEEGEQIGVVSLPDAGTEGLWIADQMKELHESGQYR